MKNVQVDADGNLHCWKCGATGFTSKRTARSKVALGVGALATKKKLKCQACGEYNDVGNADPFNRGPAVREQQAAREQPATRTAEDEAKEATRHAAVKAQAAAARAELKAREEAKLAAKREAREAKEEARREARGTKEGAKRAAREAEGWRKIPASEVQVGDELKPPIGRARVLDAVDTSGKKVRLSEGVWAMKFKPDALVEIRRPAPEVED